MMNNAMKTQVMYMFGWISLSSWSKYDQSVPCTNSNGTAQHTLLYYAVSSFTVFYHCMPHDHSLPNSVAQEEFFILATLTGIALWKSRLSKPTHSHRIFMGHHVNKERLAAAYFYKRKEHQQKSPWWKCGPQSQYSRLKNVVGSKLDQHPVQYNTVQYNTINYGFICNRINFTEVVW